MMDESDVVSDGSDIEIDSYDDGSELGDIFNVNREELNPENANLNWEDRFFESDSDDGDFEGFDADWKFENFDQRAHRTYTRNGGVSEVHPVEAMPKHYFNQVWGEGMWDRLADQTNLYAEQERRKNPPPPFAPKWVPVTKWVMKAFIGLILCMGVIRLPARNDYWRQKKRMFSTNFGKVMARDRFNLIWLYLHLEDNERPQPQEKPDKLHKLRWFLDYLSKNFMNMYSPYGYVSVDESMVKFKGRLSFRQYLPAKPIKWGVKIWVLAEATTGYMLNFQIYTGKTDNEGKGLAHRVVTDLLNPYCHTNLRVFMDNFYTSTALLNELLMRGILACGTIRSNRKGLPTPLLPKNLKLNKHEYRVAQKDDLSFCTWQDTKPVTMLSNYHSPVEIGNVNRRSGNPQQRQVEVPSMLSDYQKYMKGVDLCDQMIGYYMLDHRSRKWWRRIFFYFLMAAAHNSYIIAKDSNPEDVQREWPNFQDFVEDLAESLIDEHTNNRDMPANQEVRPHQHHDFVKLYDKKKVCVECRAKLGPGPRAGTSKWGCQQCNVPVHTQCFPNHIMRANY